MKTVSSELKMAFEAMFVFMIAVLIITVPEIAHASLYVEDVLCNGAGMFSGRAGGAVATIGMSILGIGALLGKVSWGLALIVGIGTALLFGATAIVYALTNGYSQAC